MRTKKYISESFRKDPTTLLAVSGSFQKWVFSLLGVSGSFQTQPRRLKTQSKLLLGASGSFQTDPNRFKNDPKLLLAVFGSFQTGLRFLKWCSRVFLILLYGFKKHLKGFRREWSRLFFATLTKIVGLLWISMQILWCKLGRIRAFIYQRFYVGWLPLFYFRLSFAEPQYLIIHTIHKVRHSRDPTVF